MQNFMLKIPVDLHRKIKIISVVLEISMTDFILEAVREKLAKMDENELDKGVK